MIKFLNFIYRNSINGLKTYPLLTIMFFIWLYRVDFIPADGGGIAKGIQVITIFSMLFYVINKSNKIVNKTYNWNNISGKTIIIFYLYAILSTSWAYIPTFAFFLSIQNIAIFIVLYYILNKLKTFISIENFFIVFALLIISFEVIFHRILDNPSFFVHFLPAASSSAICLSYSFSELISNNKIPLKRKRILKGSIIFSTVILITSTSSGANASALFGIIIGLLLSKKFKYVFFILIVATIIYFNQHLIDDILLTIMPGKSLETISSASGREALWDIIIEYANKKPFWGWGFACIERVVTNTGFMASDAHNNYLGIYGGLGICGLVLIFFHLVLSIIYSFNKSYKLGYSGIISAICCAALNGYSYGFLSGKACSITVIYFIIILLSYFYQKVKVYE